MSLKASWNNISMFLLLTFGLNWLLAIFIYLSGGLDLGPSIGMLLQLYMLIPAFSAIFLQKFLFKESPLYSKRYREQPHLFFGFFLVFTILFAVLTIVATIHSGLVELASYITLGLSVGGLLFIVILWSRSGTDSFARVGLSFGSPKYYFAYGLLFVGFYCGMTLLNILFNLGEFADVEQLITDLMPPESSEQVILTPKSFIILTGFQAILLGPFLGLLITFGEEYGWRAYLQDKLVLKLGRIRGVLVLGLIWGIWHAPLIVMGHNFPNYPVFGIFLMTLYTIGLAFILGLAYFQSRSVWLVAFLHALNNQTISFLIVLIYLPDDMVFSFGIGIYSLPLLALVVIFLLRYPLWREPPTETGDLMELR